MLSHSLSPGHQTPTTSSTSSSNSSSSTSNRTPYITTLLLNSVPCPLQLLFLNSRQPSHNNKSSRSSSNRSRPRPKLQETPLSSAKGAVQRGQRPRTGGLTVSLFPSTPWVPPRLRPQGRRRISLHPREQQRQHRTTATTKTIRMSPCCSSIPRRPRSPTPRCARTFRQTSRTVPRSV